MSSEAPVKESGQKETSVIEIVRRMKLNVNPGNPVVAQYLNSENNVMTHEKNPSTGPTVRMKPNVPLREKHVL